MAKKTKPAKKTRKSKEQVFDARVLDSTVISIPLLKILEKQRAKKSLRKPIAVIIDLNLRYSGKDAEAGRKRRVASERVRDHIEKIKAKNPAYKSSNINDATSQYSQQYLFARLDGDLIEELVRRDAQESKGEPEKRLIYHIWPDFEVKASTVRSISTVKADAAYASFSAQGKDIVWAVIDSGIHSEHRHFVMHGNIHGDETYHQDFTGEGDALTDNFGHGTHVAGIIAGEVVSSREDIHAITRRRNEAGKINYERSSFKRISGMAPQCKLVSFKVLDKNGNGQCSSLIAAIEAIQDINGYGRDIKIHGVNMSLGYDFQPEWFACGQSPLCVEVDRLVKSGVVVVASAGNTGYGIERTLARGDVAKGLQLSINDPGNAQLAITVGSTHRDMPHTYGVSYFSSKGPTGDGRIKPDLVAPGEKIISCAAGKKLQDVNDASHLGGEYLEDSGTSMAAPHVSGVIAGFLSIRREFIGKPEAVKEIFLTNATDLKRDRYFQGHGLVDVMRAIQSI